MVMMGGPPVMLGTGSMMGSSIWTCAKWLDAAPVGAIVRNGCAPTDDLSEGVWFQRGRDGWVWYDQWTGRTDTEHVFTTRDVFLPVQQMTQDQVTRAKMMRRRTRG